MFRTEIHREQRQALIRETPSRGENQRGGGPRYARSMCRPKAGDPPPDKHSVLCESLCAISSVLSASSLLSLCFLPKEGTR
jgi:hypothetical protein